MLQELRVEQFAIIDKVSVRFGPGLNVLTGETGAGKSLLVDALALAVGGRAHADAVRAGAKEAVVEALFAPERPAQRAALAAALESRGLPSGEGQLLVKRIVSASGRHRVYVNGGLATVALLAEVAGELVDIVGQHEHMALLRPGAHLAHLDAFADHPALLERQRALFGELEAARAELGRLDTDEAQREERQAFLRFQLQEIEALDPLPGEEERLEAERQRLAHAERLREAATFAEAALYGDDGSLVEVLGRVCARLRDAARLDPSLSASQAGLEGALSVVEEQGRDLQRYLEHLAADPGRLDAIQARLADLKRLSRRHGGDVESLLQAAERMRQDLEGLEGHDDRLEATRARLVAAEAQAGESAKALTRSRRKAAKALTSAVQAQLGDLGMASTRFETVVEPAAELGVLGQDRVALRIAPGPEEPARSLARIASGGELSRILLAIRRVLAAGDLVPTVVFDEVDAGIGGGAAEVVGRMLAGVAADRQVLCITHLPQVAAYADRHAVVRKTARGGRAHVEVDLVEGAGRVSEVARMLGGLQVTDRTRDHAEEMVTRAKAPRRGGRRRKRAA